MKAKCIEISFLNREWRADCVARGKWCAVIECRRESGSAKSFLFRWSLRLNFKRWTQKRQVCLHEISLPKLEDMTAAVCAHLWIRKEISAIWILNNPLTELSLFAFASALSSFEDFPFLKTCLIWRLSFLGTRSKQGRKDSAVRISDSLLAALFDSFLVWHFPYMKLSLFGTFHIWKLSFSGTFHIWHFLAVLTTFSPECLFTPSFCRTWTKQPN